MYILYHPISIVPSDIGLRLTRNKLILLPYTRATFIACGHTFLTELVTSISQSLASATVSDHSSSDDESTFQ